MPHLSRTRCNFLDDDPRSLNGLRAAPSEVSRTYDHSCAPSGPVILCISPLAQRHRRIRNDSVQSLTSDTSMICRLILTNILSLTQRTLSGDFCKMSDQSISSGQEIGKFTYHLFIMKPIRSLLDGHETPMTSEAILNQACFGRFDVLRISAPSTVTAYPCIPDIINSTWYTEGLVSAFTILLPRV